MIYNEGDLSLFIFTRKKTNGFGLYKLSQMITNSVIQYLLFHLEIDLILSFRN